LNKAALRVREHHFTDGAAPASWSEIDALHVPIWKSGSTAMDAIVMNQLHFNHTAHSFAGRLGTATATRDAAAIAIVRDPVQRFESAFRTMTPGLANASRDEQRQKLIEFTDRVWHGEPLVAAEHLLTQMYFLTSTDHHGQPLQFRVVGKVERFDEALRNIEYTLKMPARSLDTPTRKCTHGCDVHRYSRLLEEAPDALRKVCALYQQDFVCLGYRMPDACVARPLPSLPPVSL